MTQIEGIPLLPSQPPGKEVAAPTFARFQELPAEIRIKIWALTANSQPATIVLQWISTEFTHREVHYQIPSILLACRESNFEGLKYYTLCREVKESHTRGVFINLPVDQFAFRVTMLKRTSHRVAFPPSGSLNFDRKTIMSMQNLEYDVGPFLKPLKTLLDLHGPESRISVVFKGRALTADTTRSTNLLSLHIRVLPTYIRQIPHGKFVYRTSDGKIYTLTGDPLLVKNFLRSQTSF